MSQDATLDTTTYEVIRQRLAAQGDDLKKHIADLNVQRQELFGDSITELLTTARVATEHSCVPRDLIRLASGKLLLGYEVFLGLKKTTAISDVFAEIAITGDALEDLEPTALEILDDERFAKDFQDLFTYFKDARLDQLRRTDTHVLAVFRVGSRDSDIKVLRWALTGADMNEVSYVDNRGDRDHTFPDPHDFEWVETTREMHEHGKHPHINILDTVFVECTEGDLTIKVENNTTSGAGILAEPVEDHSQGLDDADIYYADCEGVILLKMKPYREKIFRYFIFNKLTKEAVRCDDIASACQVLPDAHGLIFPNGYYLSDGTLKVFPVDAAEMNYVRRRRAPNGEDLAYIYHHRGEGRYHILRYNMITRQADQPLVCHGYSFFDNGRLIIFRGDQEPARIHAMQIWQTPFCSDAHYASLDRGGDHKLADIGNRDLVRAISDLSQISRHITNQQPSAAIYSDLIRTLDAVIDSHHWLGDPSVGNMHDTLSTIRATAGQVIDEFEKVEQLRGQAEQQLRQQHTAFEELERSLAIAGEHDVDALVGGLDRLRRLQGRVAGLRDVRYIRLEDVEELADKVQKRFDQRAERTIEHLLAGDALAATRETIAKGEAAVEAATGTGELSPVSDEAAEIGTRLDLLLDITGSLEVGDPQARTQLLEDIGGIYSDYNRLGALIENRQRELSSTEGRAQFQVEFQLLGQAVTSSMGRCETVAACDEHQARLLAQLEELEGRYLDLPEFTEALGDKRIEIVEAFETRRQGLLEEQQRRANGLGRSAERLLKTIEHRASNMEDAESLDTYLATDPLVQKLHHLRDELRELGDTVQADDIDAKLKAIQSNSRRQLRDAADLFDGDTVSLGQHAFSRNSQELSLTMLPHDEGDMAWHLTGTDYFSTVEDDSFQQTKAYWQRETVAESEAVYRGEYLAWLLFVEHERAGKLDQLRKTLAVAEDAQALTRAAAEARLDHHYQRGLHDYDAATILTSLVELSDSAGLLRYSAQARCFAIAWWRHLGEHDPERATILHRRCRSLAKLEQTFSSSAGRSSMLEEIQWAMQESDAADNPHNELLASASAYAYAELSKQDEVHWLFAGSAADVLQHSQDDLNHRGVLTAINADLAALPVAEAEQLAMAWLQAGAADVSDAIVLEAAQAWTMSARHQTTSRRVEHARTATTVSDLLGNHPRVQQRELPLQIDEFFIRLERFHQQDVAGYQAYRSLRHDLLQGEQKRLGLDAFTLRVLGNFVRNRLIDEVYLPLIGDNFAKQIGSVGANKRTDLQGLLLLISPPGYGKTTLMEYIASILGLVFVKINGPALGHDITSVDPAATKVGTARQELEKLNLAFEMGNNVLIYLDDIQHCNPEFLQKFISLCDGQRRIEGVWRGETKTYDFRGKKVAVVMAGNPYTESGDQFRIPDMLANRADTYNLGDILGGAQRAFEDSYLENCLTANPILAPVASRGLDDFRRLLRIAEGDDSVRSELEHPYSAADLEAIVKVIRHLRTVQAVLLQVNQLYIASAATADEDRVEPPFKLQGSYRNMARLAEKIAPIMTEEEVRALILDHYRGESQTLTNAAEANLLKFRLMTNMTEAGDEERWAHICAGFNRRQAIGDDDDPQAVTARATVDLASATSDIAKLLDAPAPEVPDTTAPVVTALESIAQQLASVAEATEQQTTATQAAAKASPMAPVASTAAPVSSAKSDETNQPVINITNTLPKSYGRLYEHHLHVLETVLAPVLKAMNEQQEDGDLAVKKMDYLINYMREFMTHFDQQADLIEDPED